MGLNVVKTRDSGVVFRVMANFENTDGSPNLNLSYIAEDASGKPVKVEKWLREVIIEHGKVSNALERAGFRYCAEETVIKNVPGVIHMSEGLEHRRHKTAGAVEAAAEQALRGVGYQTQ